MEQAINAYRHITATDEFREMERLRSRARHNEAAALRHARAEGAVKGAETERIKWQGVLAERDAALTEKDAVLTEKDALIAELRKQIYDGIKTFQ
jgi:hypothetical protein